MEKDFQGKKLLILGANPETANLVNVAKEMGVTTIVTDYDPEAPAKKVADISYDINGLDVDAICEMARKEQVDGVMVGVADVLVKPYQQVCEKLGLPCYANEKTAAAFNNKRLFKQTCAEYGIEGIPEYSLDNKSAIVYPVIVKPADSNSGKGITLVRHRSELDDAVAVAKAESRTSTGEVGCLGESTSEALMTSMLSVGHRIPKKGVLLSTGSAKQKADLLESAHRLHKKGYQLYATAGTHRYLNDNGIPAILVHWPSEADKEPQALDLLHRKQIDFVVNIPKNLTSNELTNGYKIRRAAVDLNVPLITNARLASAYIRAFCDLTVDDIEIKSWDEY